jgi:hypothetical protein
MGQGDVFDFLRPQGWRAHQMRPHRGRAGGCRTLQNAAPRQALKPVFARFAPVRAVLSHVTLRPYWKKSKIDKIIYIYQLFKLIMCRFSPLTKRIVLLRNLTEIDYLYSFYKFCL